MLNWRQYLGEIQHLEGGGLERVLEPLMTLNAQRAAEEKRGLIRWLRPEYQNPGGEPVQVPLEPAPSAEPSPGAPAGTKSTPAAKRPWPKSLAEQAQAPASPEELARTFSGARSDRVADLLDTLASLGQARRLEDGRYAA